MDISRLFDGFILIFALAIALQLLVRIDSWRSSVSALHLRWEREQRQAGGGVTLAQRQNVQSQFELLVANRPMRLWWTHIAISLGVIALVLAMAWDLDDLKWVGFWLALPIGVVISAVLGYAWSLVNQANTRLAAISATLYGPAPPRVKVRSIQTIDGDESS